MPEKSVFRGRNRGFQPKIRCFSKKKWVSKKYMGFQKKYGVFELEKKSMGVLSIGFQNPKAHTVYWESQFT